MPGALLARRSSIWKQLTRTPKGFAVTGRARLDGSCPGLYPGAESFHAGRGPDVPAIRMLLPVCHVTWQCLALVVVLSCVTVAAAETPWPLKTPTELKALHGPTFTGLHILTYRRTQEP